ncbi:MAG: monovalent cation/H(+) antiporter subunit G [Streptosporangiaceae bacterium]
MAVTVHGTVADVLLGLATVVVLASSAGIVVMRDAYQKLHYVTPVTVVAPVIVALAVLVQSGWTENSGETWLGLLFVVGGGPFLAHATIRAARIRETGDWRPSAGRRGPGRGGPGQGGADGGRTQARPPDRQQPDQAAGGRDG